VHDWQTQDRASYSLAVLPGNAAGFVRGHHEIAHEALKIFLHHTNSLA
jgi:hypothetical protein